MASIGALDIAVFVLFIAAVVAVGLIKSRKTHSEGEKDVQDFFLAGRGLTWWLVGFSLIAANISTEQFVGMNGSGASHVGLAIASFEWLAAVTLTVTAFCFLPYFLRAGIYTMPQYLEYRYNSSARLLMAGATILIYLMLLGAVTYSGALTVDTLGRRAGLDIGLRYPSIFIALIAMIYVVTGGLKASVWADLIQGTALIVGGAIIMFYAFEKLGDVDVAARVADTKTGEIEFVQMDASKGSFERFVDLNSNRLNMFLPASDRVLPWTALLLGVWIPNFYYWGLNQYITQRTLGSSSLAEGQRGIVFAAYLKLIIPFVVVIPGIIAFNVFFGNMQLNARSDTAGAMAKYLKANPDTQFVVQQESPTDVAIEAHTGPQYLIAVYPNAVDLKASKAKNAYVLPMTEEEFNKTAPAKFQVFNDKEDLAWKHIHPQLAAEIGAHNAKVEVAAKEVGGKLEKQALVAYKYDTALGELLDMLPRNVGLFGFVMAALLGAVISSLAAMLNACSSILTLDLVEKHLMPNAPQTTIVLLGRISVVAFAVIACVLAPLMGDPNISNSIFTIIQGGQGLISPGILAVFVFGFLVRRAPRMCGVVGLLVNVVCYGSLWYLSAKTNVFADIEFMNNYLNWMAISFALCIVVQAIMTAIAPLERPIEFETNSDLDLRGSKGAFTAGMICIALTVIMYIVFSPLGIAR